MTAKARKETATGCLGPLERAWRSAAPSALHAVSVKHLLALAGCAVLVCLLGYAATTARHHRPRTSIGTSAYVDAVETVASHDGSAPNVLVLGSGGLVGRALTAELQRRGYNVLESRDRMHLDLRVQGSLSRFDDTPIAFCFFLACEVGGSKFIASGSNEKAITRNNQKIYDNVFPYLQRRKIPFLFSSSQLSVTGTAYGKIKAVGEELISKMPGRLGKFVRFWNVWGAEKIGLKSHILSDWVYQCVKNGRVDSHTSGLEQRQFVHTKDMASALVDLMLNFDTLPLRTDATSGQWVSMRHLAGVLAEHSPRPCTFHFAERNSSTMIGIEPKNLWKVSSPLHLRVTETFDYYEAMVEREESAAADHGPAPYLSIIMATSNDDYNGIRQRTFNFIQSLVTQAEVAHLDYELIVVQYNPTGASDYWQRYKGTAVTGMTAADYLNDLPFSQLFPWMSRHGFGRMRIITVPNSLHQWPDKGGFWEYVAKNAGAFRARGQFLLLTNPDDVYPLVLVEQLSKQQLDPKTLYKAGVVLNFNSQGSLASVLGGCNDMAAALYGSVIYNGDVHFTPDDELKQAIANYTNTQALLGDGKPDWRSIYVGDFSIFPRNLFLRLAGYAEIPQNTHVESAHLVSTFNNPSFKAGGYRMGFMDHVVCHQDHTRHGRPSAPRDIDGVLAAMSNRTDHFTSGLRSANLPEARMHDIFAAGYNPESPFRLYPHHHLFRMYEGKLWTGEVQRDYITDFLGIRTATYYDCQDYNRYRFFHLSRRIPCARHDEYFRANYSQLGLQVVGDLPIIDEEYFEWLSLLRAVRQKLDMPRDSPFIMAELGARYGTWTVRAGAAMRVLQPWRPMRLLSVEADKSSFQWLQRHVEVNGFANVTRAVRGFVNVNKEEFAFEAWERDSQPDTVASYTLHDLLGAYEHVDIMHCDIQGWERIFPDYMDLLNAKVAAIHFGTHGDAIHANLLDVFRRNGWVITQSILNNEGVPPGRVEDTAFGPVKILYDGVLAVENTALLSRLRQRAQPEEE